MFQNKNVQFIQLMVDLTLNEYQDYAVLWSFIRFKCLVLSCDCIILPLPHYPKDTTYILRMMILNSIHQQHNV